MCSFTRLNPNLAEFVNKLNLKVDIDNLEFRETDNGRLCRIQDEICGKYICLNHRRTDLYEAPMFFSIIIEVDDEDGVMSVFIRGMHLYALKKDIDWSHLFYGFPSVVTQMMDANNFNNGLLISFLGAKDFMDTTYFDSRYK